MSLTGSSLSDWYSSSGDISNLSNTGDIKTADNFNLPVGTTDDSQENTDDVFRKEYEKAINAAGLVQLLKFRMNEYLSSLSVESNDDLRLAQTKRKKDLEIIVDELSKVVSEL